MSDDRAEPGSKNLPGRPRSAEADQAILHAAFKLLVEQGFARMSVEGVAAEAGVGKSTIYRRYPGKRELVVAVLNRFFPVDHLPETGDTREEILALLEVALRGLMTIHGTRLIGTLLAEEESDPALLDFFRQRIIHPRRAVMRGILERGVRRGEIRPDADLDLAINLFLGAFFAYHVSGLPIAAGWRESVVDFLWRALVDSPKEPEYRSHT